MHNDFHHVFGLIKFGEDISVCTRYDSLKEMKYFVLSPDVNKSVSI